EATDIYFQPNEERIIVDRSRSSSQDGIMRCSERAPHTLFTLGFPPPDDRSRRENLEFHVFYDASILEVFVNERTAVSTRVYPQSGTSVGL
ncbi:hypothetical protein DER44DRAFT_619941, partial [Fusarium oxysporum]